MTPELDKYYSNRFEMMGMDGWKDLIIDIDNMIESLNNISVIPDEKTLQFRKGELSILTWLKTLREVSERAYEELNSFRFCSMFAVMSWRVSTMMPPSPSAWATD